MPTFPPLTSNAAADVCIVGAGIAGLSVAYQLACEHKAVIVVDDGGIGSGETGRTTSHLTNAFDDRYHHLETRHGREVSRLVAQSHTAAIDWVESIAKDEDIACDFRRVDGYLFAPVDADRQELEKELDAAHRAGLTGLRYDIQDDHPTRVTTGFGYTITAASTVVATNTPVNNRFVIHTKQAPYRTFVVGLRVPKNSVPWVQYWDTLHPYHYVRIARELDAVHDLLIVGGQDHKTGQANDASARFERLSAWAMQRFPVVGEAVYCWSGQVMEPIDSLAFIGLNPGDKHVS